MHSFFAIISFKLLYSFFCIKNAIKVVVVVAAVVVSHEFFLSMLNMYLP